jgi:hypothetical protein
VVRFASTHFPAMSCQESGEKFNIVILYDHVTSVGRHMEQRPAEHRPANPAGRLSVDTARSGGEPGATRTIQRGCAGEGGPRIGGASWNRPDIMKADGGGRAISG